MSFRSWIDKCYLKAENGSRRHRIIMFAYTTSPFWVPFLFTCIFIMAAKFFGAVP